MYTKEQYKKDLSFIERIDRVKVKRFEVLAYFFPFSACLVTHALYFWLFWASGIKEMMIFNIFSVLFYALMIILARFIKEKINLIYATMFEIVVHASAATIFIGWVPDFGMFLLMIIPLAYLMPNKNKIIPFMVMAISLTLYGVLKYMLLDSNKIVYNIDNSKYIKYFFFVNIAAGSSILVYITIIYMFMKSYLDCKIRVQNEQLRVMASTDPLTRLRNRRDINERLNEISEDSIQTGKHYVVGIADIDNFKRVNDTYGHDMGDVVLARVADILSNALPDKGYASRWGGEEFLFVLPDADIEEGIKTTENIHQHIRSEVFSSEIEDFSVTMTIGICEAFPGKLVDKIITKADQRLYKGKQNGKNHTEYTD
ncbi:diguanylate cyclase (GGDEF) domain-containing protein [Eubacterium ruminantium]|nr:diguanylate cyclase (GGDEF) domain-containing protein [Eubacterium ruminantium]